MISKKKTSAAPITLGLCFRKHSITRAICPFQASAPAQFLSRVATAYSSHRRTCPRLSKGKKGGRIFPGVTNKHAYNQALAENNSKCQAKNVEVNVDAVPTEESSIQTLFQIYPSPEGRQQCHDWLGSKSLTGAILHHIAKDKHCGIHRGRTGRETTMLESLEVAVLKHGRLNQVVFLGNLAVDARLLIVHNWSWFAFSGSCGKWGCTCSSLQISPGPLAEGAYLPNLQVRRVSDEPIFVDKSIVIFTHFFVLMKHGGSPVREKTHFCYEIGDIC